MKAYYAKSGRVYYSRFSRVDAAKVLLERRCIDQNTDCFLLYRQRKHRKKILRKTKGRISFHVKGKKHSLARVSAWIWLGFDLDSPLQVCHKCDNPDCWNPRHLFVGTPLDNSQDMVKKGRVSRGEDRWNAVLTEDDIRIIRNSRGLSHEKLARLFGVSRPNIGKILRHETWKHV